jgi:hypothetical protein
MKRLIFAVGLAFAVPVAAAPVDGTWKIDLSSAQLNDRQQISSIVNGVYRCSTCRPAYAIPADGKFHAVANQPGLDALAVRVVDARTVAFEDRKGGRSTGTTTLTVAPDGRTSKMSWKSVGANGKVVTGEGTQVRVAAGPKGSHAMSGTWRNAKIQQVDDAGLTMTMKEAGGMLHVSYPTGESFQARIGGPAVPIKGDLAGTMASVRRTGPNTLVETDLVKGKVVAVTTMTMVNPTTMTFVSEDKRRGGVTRYTAHK